MNKDTVVASVIGFGLGLVAAIALWIVPKLVPKISPVTKETNQVLSETTNVLPDTGLVFEITSPKDGDISKSADVKITGKAPGNTLILITTPENNMTATSDASGQFTTNLTLHEGGNDIVLTNIAGGKEETKHLVVYYIAQN